MHNDSGTGHQKTTGGGAVRAVSLCRRSLVVEQEHQENKLVCCSGSGF